MAAFGSPTLSTRDRLLLMGRFIENKPVPRYTPKRAYYRNETGGKIDGRSRTEAIKESGIGTPATRASIIETLFSREYIVREKKSLIPTNKGLVVYLAVQDKKIADVSMTGEWESVLNKISVGEMDADTFHRGIEVYAAQITAELLNQIEVNKRELHLS